MRRMIVAAVAVVALFAAGCQDQEARTQAAKAQAELDALKAKQSGGSNDALIALLANQNKTADSSALERKLTSLAEDINLDAGSVASKFDGGRTRDRNTPADTLEGYGEIVGHSFPSVKFPGQFNH